jgi:antitoxin (DNA-binding transcriptional repressor) of toxin-antitoxin stability system
VTETTREQFLQDPQRFVRAAQQERVLVTEAGRPLAVVVGLENKDAEDGQLEASPDFWRMIEQRRRRPTRPLETAERDLFAEPSTGVGSEDSEIL